MVVEFNGKDVSLKSIGRFLFNKDIESLPEILKCVRE